MKEEIRKLVEEAEARTAVLPRNGMYAFCGGDRTVTFGEVADDARALCAAIREMDIALQERTEAAAAWDALAVARLKTINEMNAVREAERAAWSAYVAARVSIICAARGGAEGALEDAEEDLAEKCSALTALGVPETLLD